MKKKIQQKNKKEKKKQIVTFQNNASYGSGFATVAPLCATSEKNYILQADYLSTIW